MTLETPPSLEHREPDKSHGDSVSEYSIYSDPLPRKKWEKEQLNMIHQKKVGTCLGKVMATRNRMAKIGIGWPKWESIEERPHKAIEQSVSGNGEESNTGRSRTSPLA